ncbi:hypothetical protein D3C81_845230 [compost metagenome]
MSRHALQRWRERHPGLDPEVEFRSARTPSKRVRRLLLNHDPTYNLNPWHSRRYYLVSPNGVVFVVGLDETVVTVMCLANLRRRARAKRREKRLDIMEPG